MPLAVNDLGHQNAFFFIKRQNNRNDRFLDVGKGKTSCCVDYINGKILNL